jgi:hypothetical protein
MNIQSFVADGKDYRRAGSLLLEAKTNQRDKPDEKDCTSLIDDILFEPGGDYRGKTFVEARTPTGQLCGVAIFDNHGDDDIFVEFLCSDCPGTGKQIVDELVRLGRTLGKAYVRLTSVPRSVGFYMKVGFEQDPDASVPVSGKNLRLSTAPKAGRRAYRRRKSRRHGSASLRRHKTRRVFP